MLERQYKNISILSWPLNIALLQCSNEDVWKTSFEAYEEDTGIPVSGAVCCSLFRSCYFRLESM